MAAHSQTSDSGPVRESARIVSLDLIRGVAVLGILLMNTVFLGQADVEQGGGEAPPNPP